VWCDEKACLFAHVEVEIFAELGVAVICVVVKTPTIKELVQAIAEYE
jgi:hypothetical protein